MLIDDVKTALRISHFALDDEIIDLVEAARHDLMLSGISSLKVQRERAVNEIGDLDPLIKRVISVYVKANFETDTVKAERFQNAYDLLKNHLSLSGDYL